MPESRLERLQKLLSAAGIASRRKAEEMILEGRVAVNGQVVTQLGTKVDPDRDEVRVDGRRVRPVIRHVYIVLNKPSGVLSTMGDPRGRKSLSDLVDTPERLYPVGRLDAASEGLMLLTDDGDLANRLTHPRYEHEKEYRVLVDGTPSDEQIEAWRRGVVLEGRRTAPARVDVLRQDRDATLLRVVMHEGRKRQIRDVASLLGHPVVQLQRIRLGPLKLGALASGQWRYLTDKEIAELTALAQSESKPPGRRKAMEAQQPGSRARSTTGNIRRTTKAPGRRNPS